MQLPFHRVNPFNKHKYFIPGIPKNIRLVLKFNIGFGISAHNLG